MMNFFNGLARKFLHTHKFKIIFDLLRPESEINDGDQQMDDKRIPDGLGSQWTSSRGQLHLGSCSHVVAPMPLLP